MQSAQNDIMISLLLSQKNGINTYCLVPIVTYDYSVGLIYHFLINVDQYLDLQTCTKKNLLLYIVILISRAFPIFQS